MQNEQRWLQCEIQFKFRIAFRFIWTSYLVLNLSFISTSRHNCGTGYFNETVPPRPEVHFLVKPYRRIQSSSKPLNQLERRWNKIRIDLHTSPYKPIQLPPPHQKHTLTLTARNLTTYKNIHMRLSFWLCARKKEQEGENKKKNISNTALEISTRKTSSKKERKVTMTQLCKYVLDRSTRVLKHSSSSSSSSTTTCGTLQIRAIILRTEGGQEGRRETVQHTPGTTTKKPVRSSNFKVSDPLRKLLYYASRAWNTNRAGSAWMCPKVTQTIVSSYASNIRLLSLS